MKFTRGWLADHLDSDAGLDRIADTLTRIGLEVESVEDRAAPLRPFVVAHVTAVRPHPNADRLRLCEVDAGAGRMQVVCGAPNARAGMKAVFAAPGARIPATGAVLKDSVIRGEASAGMLCSERELGLGDDHDGIIALADDAPVGASFAAHVGLDDPVFDIAVTPNRGDCLGVRGVARDLAAAGLGTLRPLGDDPIPGAFESPLQWARVDSAAEICPHVTGRYFRGVRNGPSPDWLANRLRAIGLRPLSALVDITNYITFDLGRPLHVYDADAIEGTVLSMDRARAGESMDALDGKTYALPEGAAVIRDGAGMQGIAGVIGAAGSGCADTTANVFLEAALFDPVAVAGTGRALNLQTDARFRFERGVDPAGVAQGVARASRLILALCGGEASIPVHSGDTPRPARDISLHLPRLASRGGSAVSVGRAADILTCLGFERAPSGAADGDSETLTVRAPSWRPDVTEEACLIEEVLRMEGLDSVEAVPLPRDTAPTPRPESVTSVRAGLARRALAARGMMEAVTSSMTSAADEDVFLRHDAVDARGGAAGLRLANPISSDLDALRRSVLAGLARAAGRNAARGIADIALFEVGPAFHADEEGAAISQAMVVAGLRAGQSGPRHWAQAARAVDAFDAKADAAAALAAWGAPMEGLAVTADAPPHYHPGQSGVFRLGRTAVAHFGVLHPRVAAAAGLKGPAVGFEAFPEALPPPRRRGAARPALEASDLMPVSRDFAFVLDADIPAERVARAIQGAAKKGSDARITDVSVFDVYSGATLGAGRKSLALSVTIQPHGAPLTEDALSALSDRITEAVRARTGGVLRQ